MTPETKPLTNLDYAAGLRALADFYEANPTALRCEHLYVFCYEREEFLAMVKMMANGGRVEKKLGGGSLDDYTATRTFGGAKLRVSIPRTQICRLVRPAEYDCPDSLLEAGKEFEEQST